MTKSLERDLGLYATITISIGAMIGSGIFVLPGLAYKIAGPAAITAYLLAGIVAMPAVLSKAEMATAMPEAGGTYLYIDRAMGPLLGTIAGVGAWFSLTFKSAFALIGLGAYLVLFSAFPPKIVALVLASLLVLVNILGVKQTGRLQSIIVTVVVAVLVLFIVDGITFVESARYHPFVPNGNVSLLAATGFVFVSYAGVTKIASVAEEVENPDRNIPLAMIGSVLLMMLVYALVVFVVVGVSDPAQLTGRLTPMAVGAERFLGQFGVVVIAAVAVVALTSMANAGVLSASRFPFAMSRDELAPPSIEYVHDRFHTPIVALLLTGAVLLLLVGFVPVLELAKLASAFKILVFSLVNVALIAFRESDLETYDPDFVSPGYPYVQLFGIVAGLVLITQMGLISIVGAIGIVVGGIVWYRVYGRERTDREGVALEAIRRTTDKYSVRGIRSAFATGGKGGVLVGLGPGTTIETDAALIDIVEPLIARRGGTVHIVRFEEVPDQVPLSHAAGEFHETDEIFERETCKLVSEFDVPVEIGEVVSHDVERAVENYVREHEVNLVVGRWDPERFHAEMAGYDVDWYMQNVPADFIFVNDKGLGTVDRIAIIGERGPFSPMEVCIGDALAESTGATLSFLSATEPGLREEFRSRIRDYNDCIEALCSTDTEFDIFETGDREQELIDAAREADLVIASTDAHHIIYDVLFGTLPDRLVEELDQTVLMVHQDEPRRHTFIRHLLDRFVF